MILSGSLTNTAARASGTGARFSFGAQPATKQSVWRASLHRELSSLPDTSGAWCGEIDSLLCLSPFLSSRSFAFTPRYDDAVLVTNASLHQVPP